MPIDREDKAKAKAEIGKDGKDTEEKGTENEKVVKEDTPRQAQLKAVIEKKSMINLSRAAS